MKATLIFPNRQDAEDFCIQWSRYSKRGHTIGPGVENVEVTVYDLTGEDKDWIDNYISKINQPS